MKQPYTTICGDRIWLEGYPTVEPKPGYQQRYIVTFSNGNTVQFSEFGEAYHFLARTGARPDRDYPFGIEVDKLDGMPELIRRFKKNDDIFGWQRKSDYASAYERYEQFSSMCQLWDISHEEYGIDSEFWLCERYL